MCIIHEQLLRDHLRSFHNMRCAKTWEESLLHKRATEAAAVRATEHQIDCPFCKPRTTLPATPNAPNWQAGLY